MRSGLSGFWGSGLACAGETAVGQRSYTLDCYLNKGGRVWKPECSRRNAAQAAFAFASARLSSMGGPWQGSESSLVSLDAGLPTLLRARSPVRKRVSGDFVTIWKSDL